MTLTIFLLTISFFFLWYGAKTAISSLEKISFRLRASSFSVSFLILGFLTSLSELSVGVNAIIDKSPEIYVGNLIGASIVIILFIIPLVAVLHNGVQIKFEDSTRHLPLALIVIGLPALLVLDKEVSFLDSAILVIGFVILAFLIQKRNGIVESLEQQLIHPKYSLFKEFSKIAIGAILIFVSSKVIVDQSVAASITYHIPSFLIGLLMLSIGTNLPELSILVYSVMKKRGQAALGDYIGSAAFNTFLLGILTIINGKKVYIESGLKLNLLFLPAGALLLYLFTTKKRLTRFHGLMLLILYAVFVITEIVL